MEQKHMFSRRRLQIGVASAATLAALLGANVGPAQAAETVGAELSAETTAVLEPAVVSETGTMASDSAAEAAAEAGDTAAAAGPTAEEIAPAVSTDAATSTSAAPAAETDAAAEGEVSDLTAVTETAADAEANILTVDTYTDIVDGVTAEDAPKTIRYEGQNREAVAVNVAKAHFSNSKKVIIVNRDKFPDAISATNISQGQYPVLYTRAGSVDQATIDLLKKMPLNEIYILGGTGSVSDAVAAQLKQATGVNVSRISGKDRYEVNVNAVKEQYTKEDHVVIASGDIYTDALYGVSYANTIDAPVVLSKKDRLTAPTVKLLQDLGTKRATLIGGTGTLLKNVETQLKNLGIVFDRIAGANRYSGSVAVAAAAYTNPDQVVVASGEVFSDALVSAPLAQKLDAPILLVRKSKLDSEVSQYLAENKVAIKTIYIQGGTGTITAANQANLAKAGVSEDTSAAAPTEQKGNQPAPTTPVTQVKMIKQNVTSELTPVVVYNPKWNESESVVRDAGKPRIVEQTIAITTVNGKETSRKVVSERVIQAGVAKRIERGTLTATTVAAIPNLKLSDAEITARANDTANEQYELVQTIKNADGSTTKKYGLQSLSAADRAAVNTGAAIDETKLNNIFLKLVNQERAKAGAAALIADPTLAVGTDKRADELAAIGSIRPTDPVTGATYAHSRPVNKNGEYEKFYTAFNYRDAEPKYNLGENLASKSYRGNPYTLNSEEWLAQTFLNQWKSSPGHYSNMLNKSYNGQWLSIAVSNATAASNNLYNIIAVQILANNSKK